MIPNKQISKKKDHSTDEGPSSKETQRAQGNTRKGKVALGSSVVLSPFATKKKKNGSSIEDGRNKEAIGLKQSA